MKTSQYIDQLRKLTPTGSDYAVAKLIHASEEAVNRYRKGLRALCPETCVRIADKLGLSPFVVICDAEAERAKSPECVELWRRLRHEALSCEPHIVPRRVERAACRTGSCPPATAPRLSKKRS